VARGGYRSPDLVEEGWTQVAGRSSHQRERKESTTQDEEEKKEPEEHRERRLLLIYLHDRTLPSSRSFCSQVLPFSCFFCSQVLPSSRSLCLQVLPSSCSFASQVTGPEPSIFPLLLLLGVMYFHPPTPSAPRYLHPPAPSDFRYLHPPAPASPRYSTYRYIIPLLLLSSLPSFLSFCSQVCTYICYVGVEHAWKERLYNLSMSVRVRNKDVLY